MNNKYKLPPGYEPIETVPLKTEVNVIYPDGCTDRNYFLNQEIEPRTTTAVGWAPITPLQKIERWTWETDDSRLAIAIYEDGECVDSVVVCNYGTLKNAEAIAQAIVDTANGFEEGASHG